MINVSKVYRRQLYCMFESHMHFHTVCTLSVWWFGCFVFWGHEHIEINRGVCWASSKCLWVHVCTSWFGGSVGPSPCNQNLHDGSVTVFGISINESNEMQFLLCFWGCYHFLMYLVELLARCMQYCYAAFQWVWFVGIYLEHWNYLDKWLQLVWTDPV